MAASKRLALVLIGFMGAGKTTVGTLLARDLERPFFDADAELERAAGKPIPRIFAEDGEAAFRMLEERVIRELLERGDGAVIAAGGGVLTREAARQALAAQARTVWLDVPFATAWERVRSHQRDRPLAVEHDRFRELYGSRRVAYAAAANAIVDASVSARIAADAIRLNVWTAAGASERLGELASAGRAVAVVDAGVAAAVPRGLDQIALPGGEQVKTPAMLERLWHAFSERELDRASTVVAVGGGATTDLTGFAAATFRRGIPWVAVPSTLVGQVDAAIGGKTAIDVAAKNDVGAFWMPREVICDPLLLETLPPREWSAGFAEVVKTALLTGGPLWELVRGWVSGPGTVAARTELVQRCGGFKAAIVAEDPTELGRRAILNLGHTIGHGVETAAAGRFRHGEAIAIGLAAALRLSVDHAGLEPAIADEASALLGRSGLPLKAGGLDSASVVAAMRHDKKRVGAGHRFVLLAALGEPRYGVELDERVVERAVVAVLGE